MTVKPSRFCVNATWDDVPHLSQKQKDELWAACAPHEREARAKGIPSLGSGKIYPVPEEQILVDPFEMPVHWPRGYGLDVGWNITAAVWFAWDRHSDVLYLWSEHYMGQQPPAVHAEAIKARGKWMRGAIDPAASGSNQKDGTKLIDEYTQLELNLTHANNAVEAGIFSLHRRMTEGRLKVFKTMQNWITEFRIYRRDDKGRVVKENDHLMDATRYIDQTLMAIAQVEPQEIENYNDLHSGSADRSDVTGY